MLATLIIHLHIPACTSLKEKRGRIKPFLSRLHREFNISAAELDLLDMWTESIIGCVMIGNEDKFLRSAMENISRWVESHWTYGDVIDKKIEVIN